MQSSFVPKIPYKEPELTLDPPLIPHRTELKLLFYDPELKTSIITGNPFINMKCKVLTPGPWMDRVLFFYYTSLTLNFIHPDIVSKLPKSKEEIAVFRPFEARATVRRREYDGNLFNTVEGIRS